MVEDTIWKVPSFRASQITCWLALSRGGGLHMHLAPL
jgi:hypothetical protein